ALPAVNDGSTIANRFRIHKLNINMPCIRFINSSADQNRQPERLEPATAVDGRRLKALQGSEPTQTIRAPILATTANYFSASIRACIRAARSGEDGCELNMLLSPPSSSASFWNAVTKPWRFIFFCVSRSNEKSSASVSCDCENCALMNDSVISPSCEEFSAVAMLLPDALAASRAAATA